MKFLKRSSGTQGTQLGQRYSVLPSLKLEQLWTKILGKTPTAIKALSCGADAFFPARHPRISLQHVRACAAGDGAICFENRKIVPYDGTTPILEMARTYGLCP